jgi:hypothetical protein
MRTPKAIVFAALASGVVSLFGSLPANTAVLSVGPANGTGGGFVCADVRGGNIAIPTPVEAYDCHAGPNQQYEFNGRTIYALGGLRCLDIRAVVWQLEPWLIPIPVTVDQIRLGNT